MAGSSSICGVWNAIDTAIFTKIYAIETDLSTATAYYSKELNRLVGPGESLLSIMYWNCMRKIISYVTWIHRQKSGCENNCSKRRENIKGIASTNHGEQLSWTGNFHKIINHTAGDVTTHNHIYKSQL